MGDQISAFRRHLHAVHSRGECCSIPFDCTCPYGCCSQAYRLAPADGPLTEDAFGRTPLDFVGPGILRWDGNTKTQLPFNATTVSVGTFPPGSQWRKNPLPRSPTLWSREGPSFEPICEESEECKALADPKNVKNASYSSCRCSGHSNAANKNGPYILAPNLEIVDSIKVPASLKPGDYVLQWRWDCEGALLQIYGSICTLIFAY